MTIRQLARRSRAGLWFPILAMAAVVVNVAAGDERAPTSDNDPVLGSPAAAVFEDPAGDAIVVEPGTPIRRRADRRAQILTLVDAVTELPALERRGGWVLVRYAGWQGWIAVEPAAEEPQPSPRAVFRRQPDADRLLRARQILGLDGEPERLGPYLLYTDVEDADLHRFLSDIAADVPNAYRRRYGLQPGPIDGEVVVLFAERQDYRAYQGLEEAIADLDIPGHAAHGVAALFVGERSRDSVAAVLVHELTHLLNRAALGEEVPTWVEEGLAEDLALSRVDASGRLEPGTLGGRSLLIREPVRLAGNRVGTLQRLEITGSRVALKRLIEARSSGQAPQLAQLVDLSWMEFLRAESRELYYAEAAFFVRYLLDGDGGDRAAGLRHFLGSIAAGGPGDGASLVDRLGTSWPVLERRFDRWLRAQERALQP